MTTIKVKVNIDPTSLNFIRESNRIEGIYREPTDDEIEEFKRFMAQDFVHISDLEQFVRVHQPGAKLRDKAGMNVQIGSYLPIGGGIVVKTMLFDIMQDVLNCIEPRDIAYAIHQRYERLHPFMDGNGRSGRMLWMWMMKTAPLGFLHTWYYQSLNAKR